MPVDALPAIQPGEIIREDVLSSAGLSVTQASELLSVSADELHPILAGRRPLSALFGSSPEMWMRLQDEYDRKAVSRINQT